MDIFFQGGQEEWLDLQIDRGGTRTILGAETILRRNPLDSLMNAWSLIGFGANVSVIVMALAWAVARRLKNASLIEAAWTYGFAIVACLYALIGSGTPFRKSLIAGMVLVSSTLLATSLLRGIIWHHPTESDRYALLREQFPKRPAHVL